MQHYFYQIYFCNKYLLLIQQIFPSSLIRFKNTRIEKRIAFRKEETFVVQLLRKFYFSKAKNFLFFQRHTENIYIYRSCSIIKSLYLISRWREDFPVYRGAKGNGAWAELALSRCGFNPFRSYSFWNISQ